MQERIEELSRLAEAVKNGRPELITDLLRASSGIVHALARASLGDTLAAEEAATDALARVAAGISGLRDPRAYPRWIARITRRCAVDASKRGVPSGAAVPEEAVDPAGGPQAAARAVERSVAVRAVVRVLPQKLRAPVLLHFVTGLSYREVARTLGTSLSTVSRRMEKAFVALRRALGEEP